MGVRGATLPFAQPEKYKAVCDCTTLPQRYERLVDYSQDRGTYSFLEVICLLSLAVTKVAANWIKIRPSRQSYNAIRHNTDPVHLHA